MATKSVIEIDVLDEKFKAFADLFEKYQASLKKMPGDWQKVNAAANQSSATVAKNIGQAAKSQKDLNKALGNSAFGFSNMASLSGTIAKNLASGALSLAKWASYASLGGYAAMTGLAARASTMRSQAQGLGISTGSLRAANVNLGRFISPEGVLGNIADVQADLSRGQILSRLGGKQGQDPAEMLGTVMKNAVEMFKQGGKTSQYAETMGLTQVFSMEELRRLSSLTEEELQKTIKAYEKDRQMLAVSDANSRTWQEFWVQVKRSSNELETSLLKNLVKLTPQLEKFTSQVIKLVDEALGSEALKQGIENFTNFLASPEFKDNAKFFIKSLKELGDGVVTVLRKVGLLPDNKSEEMSKAKVFQNKLAQEQYDKLSTTQKKWFVDPSKQSEAVNFFMGKGLSRTQAIGMAANLQAESKFNPSVVGDEGKAYGIAQWHPDRQADFERTFGKSIKGSTFQEQLEFVMHELNNKEVKAKEQLMQANTMAEAVKAGLAYERPRNVAGETINRVNIANTIDVQVSSTAGSDITAVAKGLPR